MKFKAGDKVIIVSNKEMEDFQYSGKWPGVAPMMFNYCGQTAIIDSVWDNPSGVYFRIDLDEGEYYWTEDLVKRFSARLG